ncbi:MAG: SAVED domain-containing protein [Thaumarchaeota archaeon]|nr:SAVED domain-containing protein [Nitrososphaerota archaeon]
MPIYVALPGNATPESEDGLVIKDVTRHIKNDVRFELWWRAGGRCQFAGCNKALWKSSVTQEPVNIAQVAHIYSFSDDGPRGRGLLRYIPKKLNEIENLMLMCHECHRKIDNHKDGGRYTPELLRVWKQEHEHRIEMVIGINPAKKSLVIHYKSRIGDFVPDWDDTDSYLAMFPERYPASDHPVDLSMKANHNEKSESFWKVETDNLAKEFRRKVTERIEDGKVTHLSVFAMAPQPLLFFLGTLLGNIVPASVYQRHRRPEQTWQWPDDHAPDVEFKINRPQTPHKKKVVLLFALSSDIPDSEIAEAMKGEEFGLWKVYSDNPSVHYMGSKKSLSEFYRLVGTLYDDIKNAHGADAKIHLLPVMSNACAIEAGRAVMQKASLPITVYDKVTIDGKSGFVPAVNIHGGKHE